MSSYPGLADLTRRYGRRLPSPASAPGVLGPTVEVHPARAAWWTGNEAGRGSDPRDRTGLGSAGTLRVTRTGRVLRGQVSRAQEIVPELVGVSLASTAEGLTFTFVASSDMAAALDALQYLDGGRVEASQVAQSVDVPDADALDERQGELFSRGESAAGGESTPSMPVLDDIAKPVGVVAARRGVSTGEARTRLEARRSMSGC